MSKNKRRPAAEKIRFSIGARLITIVSLLVLVSLGSVTVFVSWFVRGDLKTSAEINNLEVNRRLSAEVETTLANARSNSRMFIQAITAQRNDAAAAQTNTQQLADLFFSENTQIASLFYAAPGKPEQVFVNKLFFIPREINAGVADSYFQNQKTALERAVRGETVLLNAASYFSGPLLAMFFPLHGGGAGVLFSSEPLNNSFDFGANQSYMINRDGDIIIPAGFTSGQNAVNPGDRDFIQSVIASSESSKQQLIDSGLAAEQDTFTEIKDFFNLTREKIISFFYKDYETRQSNAEKTRILASYTKLNIAGVTVITSTEYDRIFERINILTRRNICITAFMLIFSAVFIGLFAKRISVPLRKLAFSARQIEGGKFDLVPESKRYDEIGVLTSGFRKMCAALNVFGRFTNREIAVKIMKGEIQSEVSPKYATVFFSSIRGFNAKLENIKNVLKNEASSRIVQWFNRYLTGMIKCVEKTNGVLDKFIGDTVMAHWGTVYTTGSSRKDAFNCVKSALMMRQKLYFMNKSREPEDDSNPVIHIGCGINSGFVTAGQLGSDTRMEYTVIGDSADLAFRIEALTRPLGVDILISESTWQLIWEMFVTEEMPPVTVKENEKPMRLFAVINFRGSKKGPRNIKEVRRLLGIKNPDLSKVTLSI
jgi:adenylate cyclase